MKPTKKSGLWLAIVVTSTLMMIPANVFAQRGGGQSKGSAHMSPSRSAPARSAPGGAMRSAPRGAPAHSYSPAPMSAPSRSAPAPRAAPMRMSQPSRPAMPSHPQAARSSLVSSNPSTRPAPAPKVQPSPTVRSSPPPRMSSPRSVPTARSETMKSAPMPSSTRPAYRAATPSQNIPPARAGAGTPGYQSRPTSGSMTREPLRRMDHQDSTNFGPQKSRPGADRSSPYGSRSLGDRNWNDQYGRYRPGGPGGGGYNNRNDRSHYGNHGYRGPYPSHYPSYPYNRYSYYGRYPYYSRYGCYQPYYRPCYSYYYPWFVPTFSFGLGYYWGTPAYYDSYYATPTVVYTTPTTVVETVPAYGGSTYYAETPTYADSGTTYVETTPPVESYSGTFVDRQYDAPAQPRQVPVTQSPQTTSVPGAGAPSPEAQQAPPKEPDPKVLAAVSQGNEHFGAGRYGEARRSYGEAMLIDRTDGVAKLLFGLASFAEVDYMSASTTVREAMDATPDLIWYPFNVKALYRNDGRFDEHLDALARQAQAQPGDHQIQFLLGYLRYASGDAAGAKAIFTALATSHPSDELYMALRDASSQAFEAKSRPSSQATPTSSGDTSRVPVVPVPQSP